MGWLTMAAMAELPRAIPSKREIEIIHLLAEGNSNRKIATDLGISVRTVETHRSHIMRKLHLRSVVDLVYYAIEQGIVPQRREATGPAGAGDRSLG